MVKLQLIKDADGVVMTFDEEYEIVLSLPAFHQLTERLERVADDGKNHMAHWLFDPDDEDVDENAGYEERNPYATEDE